MRHPSLIQFFLAFVAAFLGLRLLYREFGKNFSIGWGLGRQRREVQRVFQQLQEIERAASGTGMVPAAEHWDQLQRLQAPWGSLVYESLKELRASGGALLPTLRRMKELAAGQIRALAEARARSSQAVAQAVGCSVLIPAFGGVLYYQLPGVSNSPWLWATICGFALLVAGLGSCWLISMAEDARWAGLPRDARSWMLASQCAGERSLALVRSGSPADLAWVRACALLSQEAPSLALAWGHSIWKAPLSKGAGAPGDPSSLLFIEAGESLRKSVQLSLMEGRPCAERVEASLTALSHEIRARVEAELTLLATRALRPLFLCVAPGVFLLLGAGFYLCFEHLAG